MYRIERDEQGLTGREREVLALLVIGKSQSEIGRSLKLSRQRVGQIVGELRRKEALPDNP